MPTNEPAGVNYGVHQSGGISNVANQAVGPGASITAGPVSWQNPAAWASLDRLLDEHSGQLSPQAHEAATELRTALATGASGDTLKHRLEHLAALAAPIPAVVEAANALRQAFGW